MKLVLTLLAAFITTSSYAYRNEPRVFRVNGTGTGFLVEAPSGETYVMTNWHVCLNSSTIYVTNNGLSKYAKVVRVEPTKDLCLAKLETNAVRGFKIAASASTNQSIRVIGHPAGSILQITSQGILQYTATIGLPYPPYTGECEEGFEPKYKKIGPNVYSLDSCVLRIQVQDTTAIGAPGSSGSPVLNSKNEIVGVVNHTVQAGKQSQLGIIPLSTVKDYLSGF